MLPRPGRRRHGGGQSRLVIGACAAFILSAVGASAWLLRPGPDHDAAMRVDIPALPLATEPDLAAEMPGTLTLHRFAANPRILVFDFPSLRQQGLMFNRIAVFAEKAGLPHDRVLNDAELAAAVQAQGETIDTYYYGHDYGSATVARFFRAADAGHIALNDEEHRLRALAEAQGLLADDAGQAIITLPRAGADKIVDDLFRRTILHHELAHGEYFTDAAYAAFAGRFYRGVLSAAERAAFQRFLASQGYDTDLQDLMANETQAYLMFTPDSRAFSADAVGLDAADIARLRARFRAGMPEGWLKAGAALPD